MAGVNRVKTAVIGCGMISNSYINNFLHNFSIIDLYAVSDVRLEAAREKAAQFDVPRVMAVDEVMKDNTIELIVNLTPPFAHHEILKKAILSGKHAYTEKMLCTTLEEGEEIVNLARQKEVYLGSAPDLFMGAGIQTAIKVIEGGFIGEVTSVMCAANRDQAMASEKYGFLRGPGGAFPYDIGVYFISALLAMFGPAQCVCGFGRGSGIHEGILLYQGNYGEQWELYGNNLVTAALQFNNGILGTLHFNGNSTNDSQNIFHIYGTEGMLKLGTPDCYNGSVILVRKGGEECRIPFTHGYQGYPLYGNPGAFAWAGHRGLGAAEMAWSIRENRLHRATGEMALHAMEILFGIDMAARENVVYTLKTGFEQPRPLRSGYLAEEMGGSMRSDSELSLCK